MSDRAFLFLFSLVLTLAGLAGMGWLIVTGQAATFDGLFLFCCCGVNSLAFGLYLRWLIKSASPQRQPNLKSGRATASVKEGTTDGETTAILQDVH